MSDWIIKVEGLGKRYRIRHEEPSERYTALRDVLANKVKGLFHRPKSEIRNPKSTEDFWALRDVSFQVRQGEVVGIIGRNGAGKSTLLKILSRITEPTAGRVRLRGRLASLLEVGTGFHPELTGRENIFLNGAILGMTRAEIKRKFDEIVGFAGVEKFLDTPVKRYSSGLHVRLAFAVAAHLEPEILVIDEVLAVGDVVFQRKCLGKMQNIAATGRTVLFVSHNMQTIVSLTDRCLCLELGSISATGKPGAVVQHYLATQARESLIYLHQPEPQAPTITRVELKTSHPRNTQHFGAAMEVHVEIATPFPVRNAAISFQVISASQQPVLHVLNLDSELPMLRASGTQRLVCRFPCLRLYPGHYHLKFHLGASNPRRKFSAPSHVCPFEVTIFDRIREFYWYPEHATYVEDCVWESSAIN